MPRTPEEINQEFANTCAALGDSYHQRDVVLPEKISRLVEKVSDLRKEHAEAVKAQEQAKAVQ